MPTRARLLLIHIAPFSRCLSRARIVPNNPIVHSHSCSSMIPRASRSPSIPATFRTLLQRSYTKNNNTTCCCCSHIFPFYYSLRELWSTGKMKEETRMKIIARCSHTRPFCLFIHSFENRVKRKVYLSPLFGRSEGVMIRFPSEFSERHSAFATLFLFPYRSERC